MVMASLVLLFPLVGGSRVSTGHLCVVVRSWFGWGHIYRSREEVSGGGVALYRLEGVRLGAVHAELAIDPESMVRSFKCARDSAEELVVGLALVSLSADGAMVGTGGPHAVVRPLVRWDQAYMPSELAPGGVVVYSVPWGRV